MFKGQNAFPSWFGGEGNATKVFCHSRVLGRLSPFSDRIYSFLTPVDGQEGRDKLVVVKSEMAKCCGPVVRTEHEQREDLKNRMLKNMNAIRVWPLRIERDINSQSGEDLIWRSLSRLSSLPGGALWLR